MPLLQVNSVTAWIDGSSIYGPSSSWSDSLRSFSGGLLTSGSEWNMPSQEGARNLMWSAPDPSTGDHGAQGLFGENLYLFYSHSHTLCCIFFSSWVQSMTCCFELILSKGSATCDCLVPLQHLFEAFTKANMGLHFLGDAHNRKG